MVGRQSSVVDVSGSVVLWFSIPEAFMRGSLPEYLFALVALALGLAASAGFPAWALLGLMVAALCGYDWAALQRRLIGMEPDAKRAAERSHLGWMTTMAGVGLLLGAVALALRSSMRFSALLLIAGAAVALLGVAARRVRKGSA
jgi:hypothetical protein